jgi:hypothetical protein
MKTHWTLIALVATIGAFMSAAAWSQQARPEQAPSLPGTVPPPATVVAPPRPSNTGVNTIGTDATVAGPIAADKPPVVNPWAALDQPGVGATPFDPNVRNLYSKIDQIIHRLREADELHKPELVKELGNAIAEEFDADMKHREADLTKLEERVAKLRAQLERRKKAKSEITQLQTKVLVNEIEGLGFSHPQTLDANDFRASTPTLTPMLDGADVPSRTEYIPPDADPFTSPGSQRAVAPPPTMPPR